MFCDIRVWGPATWTALHCMAASYSGAPTVKEKKQIRAFLKTFAQLLPCPMCASHFRRMVESMPADALDNRDKFVEWTVMAHNEVNRRNGKPEVQAASVPGNLNAHMLKQQSAISDGHFLLWTLLALSVLVNIGLGVVLLRRRHLA